MAWRLSENSSSVKPEEVDKTSSRKNVYVRKDFVEVPTLDMDGQETGETHWQYMEMTVLKADWEVYETAINTTDLAEQNEADIAYIAMETGIEL